MEDRNQCIDAVRNNQGGLQIASFELDDNRALPRKWLQVGDHLVDRSTEYLFKLFLQDVLSRSEQRLVHLSELNLSFVSLSEQLFRWNRRGSGQVHFDHILEKPNLEVRIVRLHELLLEV